jgi:hypothetical protein
MVQQPNIMPATEAIFKTLAFKKKRLAHSSKNLLLPQLLNRTSLDKKVNKIAPTMYPFALTFQGIFCYSLNVGSFIFTVRYFSFGITT